MIVTKVFQKLKYKFLAYNFEFMLSKHEKYFAGTFTKNNLRKPNGKKAPMKPKIGHENSAISEDFQKVLDHFSDNGMSDKAKFLKMVFEKQNGFSKDLLDLVECPERTGKLDKINELPPSDALALMLRLDLSHAQYQSIKNVSDYQNAHFLPSLHVIQDEKEECLPDNIKVTEDEAIVPLEDMMEKTFERHMEDDQFKENVKRVHKKNGEEIMKLEAYYKLGYDCASGQSQFKVSTTMNYDNIHISVVNL